MFVFVYYDCFFEIVIKCDLFWIQFCFGDFDFVCQFFGVCCGDFGGFQFFECVDVLIVVQMYGLVFFIFFQQSLFIIVGLCLVGYGLVVGDVYWFYCQWCIFFFEYCFQYQWNGSLWIGRLCYGGVCGMVMLFGVMCLSVFCKGYVQCQSGGQCGCLFLVCYVVFF